MALSVTPLASSSDGNSVLIQNDKSCVLIDCGISFRRIKNSLEELGKSCNDIDGILITHEHKDHVAAADMIKKKTSIPMFASPRTKAAIGNGQLVDFAIDISRPFNIGDLEITPFRTPHDSVESLGYCIQDADSKVFYATDVGCINHTFTQYYKGSDIVMIESNHDIEMLKNNMYYPPFLIARILSNTGHLSNKDCSTLIEQMLDSGIRKFILGHLSDSNNTDEKARSETVYKLDRCGAVSGKDYELCIAAKFSMTPTMYSK